MQDVPAGPRAPRSVSAADLVILAAGLALFAYFVQRAGPASLAAGIANIGWGFLLIVLLGGVRFAARTLTWRRCIEPGSRPPFRVLFRATLAGDALGNLTPLGLFLSEPIKALYVADRLPLVRALSALAVENFFYTLSAFVVIAAGFITLPLAFAAPAGWWTATLVIVGGLAALALAAHAALSQRVTVLSRVLAVLTANRFGRRFRSSLPRVAALESRTFDLYAGSRRNLLPLTVFDFAFHAAGVAELYVTLALLTGQPPTLLEAFLFESLNRFVNAAFKFVPLRLGVDEAGTGLFAALLRFSTTTGVALAIVRKARVLVWVTVGATLLARRGLLADLRARVGQTD